MGVVSLICGALFRGSLEDVSSCAKLMVGFYQYLRNDGSFGQALVDILQYATPDQKKRLNRAIKKRRQAVAATKIDAPRLNGVFRTLHKKPNLLLEISSKFSNRACSINDASSGYLLQAELEKIVDEKTGKLTRLGEAVISGASEGIQVLRFPHIYSCQINHLRHDRLEESARMAQSSR
ncbi:hypothetical protein [Xanthomonas hortorum]|uniref:hypothetical protein n=1 Tax=Xanthomonas hortorum TaxID=56454 RepID=UPI001ABF4997|nr:hypothetical protein [Xanthomonas hortorum]